MVFLKFFRVPESALIADPIPTLARCVGRREVALVKSEGFLVPQAGRDVLAILTVEDLRELLKGSVFPADQSKSWDAIPTDLAPGPETPP